MQKVLAKRVFRDLRNHAFRYLALGLLIILGMYIIISMVGKADTVIIGVDKIAEKAQLEDGQFCVFEPLTGKEEEELAAKGVTLEKMFYLDFALEDKSVLRIFQSREKINRITLDSGKLPEKEDEIVLEKRYAQEKSLHLGESIVVGKRTFYVTGIGSTPDYDAPLRNLSDSAADSDGFGVGFVNSAAYGKMKAEGNSGRAEEYVYAYLLGRDISHGELKETIQNLGNLTQFIKAEDNPRIKASSEDQVIDRVCGMIAGIIVLVLFTYVISVFVVHGIEKEGSIIGTLYALGAKRKDLMAHYLILPVAVTFIAGCIGTAVGYSPLGADVQIRDCYRYYSLPELETVYSPYILVYGIILPPLIAAFVNCVVIWKHLSQPALKLIRNELRSSHNYNLDLGNMGFVARFCIRQMIREARSSFTVLFAMFIALLILMLGVDCYVLCAHISVDNKKDTKFEYMYTYKYPQKDIPEGGEEAFSKALKKEAFGNKLDVVLMGIHGDNPYFDVQLPKEASRVIISSAMAEKYRLSSGDRLVLTDEGENRDYAFTVDGITAYSTSLYVFMDIDNMRDLFGESRDYYNVVFAGRKLDIPSGWLYATTTRDEIAQSSDVFVSKMMPMITMLVTVSALVFCVVMYLMMKVMIDRSAMNISLVKIFGYRPAEIKKLYLNGNFYIVAIGAAILLPLAKAAIDAVYPVIVSNIACGMNLKFPWQMYLGIYAAVILFYVAVNRLLLHRLDKIAPAEVLKNRE